MQKKLIALAIAGLSGAAFAQSNVTVYGALALGQESVQATGATAPTTVTKDFNILSRGRLSSNSSLLGFKGSEKLGNGLTAVFQYETAFAADTAGALGGGRDTYIGLAGGFGTVAAGTLTHPMRVLGAKVDHNPAASSIGFTGSMYGEFNGHKTGTDERATNAIAYISPTVSGFHGVFAYVNGESKLNSAQNTANSYTCLNNTGVTVDEDGKAIGAAPTAANAVANACPSSATQVGAAFKAAGLDANSSAWQIAGVYDQGPLFVGLAYHNATDPAVVNTNPALIGTGINSKFKATRLAATYTIAGATKLSFLWDSQKASGNLPQNGGSGDMSRTAWMMGASHTMGANQIYVQYALANDLTGSLVTGVADTGSKQITLGYAYSLSKRTTAHAYYSKITNEANANYDFYVNPVGLNANTGNNAGADPTGYGLGLRHTF